ncbi:hypothetical protein FJZ26_03835 [Candidatus Parvarchaeota archaeon]|nr:hypothetical protein [Candidatus Parvarchaeota archaeon]
MVKDYKYAYKGEQELAVAYCRDALFEVSRSFALTIPMLEHELRDKVTVGYIVARVLDTLEDSPIPLELKKILMDEWIELISADSFDSHSLEKVKIKARLANIISRSSAHISHVAYGKLVSNLYKVYVAITKFDKPFILSQHKWFKQMNDGMKKYLTKKIMSFEDLDEYSYCVAGTVGGFLTDIICQGVVEEGKKSALRATCRDFGLLLQKVNIIRDFRQDVLGGRYFWPRQLLAHHRDEELLLSKNRSFSLKALCEMVKDARSHVANSRKYIDSMPAQFRGYKMFALVNFYMAIETLGAVEQNADLFFSDKPVKIGRQRVAVLIAKARLEAYGS